jgi:hypothetical protein
VSLAHLHRMDEVLEIEFSEALVQLQALLGQQVRALVNVHGTFAACVIEGELERVDTLPPDNRAISLVIAGGQQIVLDPDETDALLVGNLSQGEGSLEFHLPSRVVARLERA